MNEYCQFASPPPKPDIKPDFRVGFILSPRFSLLPLACFIDSLRHASDEADYGRQIYCTWKIIAPSLDVVTASCGIEVNPNELFPDLLEFDFLVVVGGQLPWCLDHSKETFKYIQQASKLNISIIGLCTGSFVLAQAGLLDNRRCAVHVEHLNKFKDLYPHTLPESDQFYINDNEIITCPGGTSALDLVFSLIKANSGKARAIKAMTSLLIDKNRAPQEMKNRLFNQLAACGNQRVVQAGELMELYISTPYKISKLAQKLNISERELNRAFIQHVGSPPSAVWRKMRISHGHWLLVNSTMTITRIAHECGFSDGAHFSRWFKERYNQTPTELRKQRLHTNDLSIIETD